MRYKGKETDISEIGRALNVRTVFEGSVRKADDTVRITAQLINVQNQAHLWSENYERELRNIFAIQREIAEHVAGALKIRLAGLNTVDEGERIELSRSPHLGERLVESAGAAWRARRRRA